MAIRNPLVLIAGIPQELPSTDSISGAPQGQQGPAGAAGPSTLSNVAITGAKSISMYQELAIGNSGATYSIDFTLAQFQSIVLSAASVTLTLLAPPGVGHYQLKVQQDATGSRTLAWAGTGYSATRWFGSSSAIAPLAASSSYTIYNFYWDGSAWWAGGMHVGAA